MLWLVELGLSLYMWMYTSIARNRVLPLALLLVGQAVKYQAFLMQIPDVEKWLDPFISWDCSAGPGEDKSQQKQQQRLKGLTSCCSGKLSSFGLESSGLFFFFPFVRMTNHPNSSIGCFFVCLLFSFGCFCGHFCAFCGDGGTRGRLGFITVWGRRSWVVNLWTSHRLMTPKDNAVWSH